MQHGDDDVSLTITQDANPEWDLAYEIEAACRLCGDQLVESIHRVEHLGVEELHRLVGREDLLHGLTEVGAESGTQRLMTLHEELDRCVQRVDVDLVAESDSAGHVVGRGPGIHAIDEPQPSLRVRERDDGFPFDATQRHIFLLAAELGQIGDPTDVESREHGGQIDLEISFATRSRDESRGEQRIATQREDVVAQSDPLNTEELGDQ